MNKLAYMKGYMDKTAAPRWIKMYQQGKLSLEDVIRIAKVIKSKPRFLRPLGEGWEGVADLVTHPTQGIVVRKSFNPGISAYNPKYLAAKYRKMKQLAREGKATKVYGKVGYKPVYYTEYLPETLQAVDKAPPKEWLKLHKQIKRTADQLTKYITHKHPGMSDYSHNLENYGRAGKDQPFKLLDFMYPRPEGMPSIHSAEVPKGVKSPGFMDKFKKVAPRFGIEHTNPEDMDIIVASLPRKTRKDFIRAIAMA